MSECPERLVEKMENKENVTLWPENHGKYYEGLPGLVWFCLMV
jgi:hypothetical protein